MWKKEFTRLFFNKKTLIIVLLLTVLGFASFYVSYQDKSLYLTEYNKGSSDINMKEMKVLIDEYNGLRFNLDYYLTSDFIQLYVIVLFLFIGIFLSSEIQKSIETGYQNYILSRTSYKKYVKNILIAQSLYISIIIFITFFITTFIGFIIGGVGTGTTSIGYYKLSYSSTILIICFQYVVIALLSIFVNGICLFSNICFKSTLLIQCLPIALFLIFPLVISSSIRNIIPIVGKIVALFIPFDMIFCAYTFLQYKFCISLFINLLVPFIIYFSLFVIVFSINKIIFSKDCL